MFRVGSLLCTVTGIFLPQILCSLGRECRVVYFYCLPSSRLISGTCQVEHVTLRIFQNFEEVHQIAGRYTLPGPLFVVLNPQMALATMSFLIRTILIRYQ